MTERVDADLLRKRLRAARARRMIPDGRAAIRTTTDPGALVEHRRLSGLAEGSESSGDPGTLLRLGWMLAGPALLAILAILIWMGAAWTFTVKDALFWVTVA